MNNMLQFSCITTLLGVSLISQATAQLSFIARESKMQFQYLYGFADQTRGGGEVAPENQASG
jgi:hypothetical protein